MNDSTVRDREKGIEHAAGTMVKNCQDRPYFGTLTFHPCSHTLHRYFDSTAASWPSAAAIVLRLLNMYSLLPHFGQVFFVRSMLAVSRRKKSSVEFKVAAGGYPRPQRKRQKIWGTAVTTMALLPTILTRASIHDPTDRVLV